MKRKLFGAFWVTVYKTQLTYWQFGEPVVEHDPIVCITSLKSRPLLFVGILATIDFTVLCVIGLSLRIIVTGSIYCLEGGRKRSVSESFRSHCPATLSWPLTFILTVADRNRKESTFFFYFTTKCQAYLCVFQSSSISLSLRLNQNVQCRVLCFSTTNTVITTKYRLPTCTG